MYCEFEGDNGIKLFFCNLTLRIDGLYPGSNQWIGILAERIPQFIILIKIEELVLCRCTKIVYKHFKFVI